MKKWNINYEGVFSVYFYPGKISEKKIREIAPPSTTFNREKYSLTTKGKAYKSIGAIQLVDSESKYFYFGYRFLKKIEDANGNLLWQNWDEEEE